MKLMGIQPLRESMQDVLFPSCRLLHSLIVDTVRLFGDAVDQFRIHRPNHPFVIGGTIGHIPPKRMSQQVDSSGGRLASSVAAKC